MQLSHWVRFEELCVTAVVVGANVLQWRGVRCPCPCIDPTFPRCHPNSWKPYHRPAAKGTVSPLQPSDGLILAIGPRLEGHSVIFLAIQTHPSCRFHLVVDFPGLRRSGSWSQTINQAQDFPEP